MLSTGTLAVHQHVCSINMRAQGFQEHSLMKGRTFDEMVRWRNGKLMDMLRVLERAD